MKAYKLKSITFFFCFMISCFAYYFIGDTAVNTSQDLGYHINSNTTDTEQATLDAQDTDHTFADTQ